MCYYYKLFFDNQITTPKEFAINELISTKAKEMLLPANTVQKLRKALVKCFEKIKPELEKDIFKSCANHGNKEYFYGFL